MGQRLIVVDAQDVLELMKHYTAFAEDNIPMEGRVLEVGVSAFLQRWISFLVEGAWEGEDRFTGGGQPPLQVRYGGRRILTWEKTGDEPRWMDEEETKFG